MWHIVEVLKYFIIMFEVAHEILILVRTVFYMSLQFV